MASFQSGISPFHFRKTTIAQNPTFCKILRLNRTVKLKLAYFGSIAAAILIGSGLAVGFGFHSIALIAAASLMVPGRIVGYFWRELITGRKLMDSGRHGDALPLLGSFVQNLDATPWLESLIWIAPSIYTVRTKAMALNNRGVCHLELGDLDSAERDLIEALELDPLYPIPHFNLAVIEMARDQESESHHHLAASRELGFTGGGIDQILDRVKTAYAKLEPAAIRRN